MPAMFKKGHIIPRWCHITTEDRKAQHNCVFGCDVVVSCVNGVVKIDANGGGAAIIIRNATRKMKNGTRKKTGISITNIHLTGCETGCKFSVDRRDCAR